ncbi:MAG TPA: hypothetical protein VGQ83_30535 [Polyangia bacterium]
MLVSAFALALVAGGCGGDAANVPPGSDGGHQQQDSAPLDCVPALFVVSQQAVTIQTGTSADLTVRYTCDGVIKENVSIAFAIQGTAGGSQLSAMSSPTNGAGEATITVTGGTTAGHFQVQASAPSASPISFDVTVTTDPVGAILVKMTYGGTKTFNEFKAYLYQNKTCGDLDAFALATALQVSAPQAVVSAEPKFQGVNVGANYAVAVTAKNGANLLGFGCVNSLAVTSGQTTNANVTISDLPVTYNGTYLLDNHFDLTGVLPPSVGTVVHMFDELTDDHEISQPSLPANKKYGEDPYAFVLDIIYRQFCKWECTSGDFDTCTPVNHPTGDLTDLYTQNFQSWSGAQPYFYGMCGALELGHGLIQQQMYNWVTNLGSNAVNTVLAIANIGGDLARAIDKMHIKSKLTLSDVRPGRNSNFTHELKTFVLDLHGLDGVAHTYEVDLVAAGMGTQSYSGSTTVVSDKLQIPVHTFQLKLGMLLQYVYLHFLLPALGYANSAEMLASFIDCVKVGDWLYQQIGFVQASQFKSWCDAGLTAAGGLIDSNFNKVTSAVTAFTLQGSADPDQIDDHRVATSLKNGVWNGSWSENGTSHTFAGTFTGVKQ